MSNRADVLIVVEGEIATTQLIEQVVAACARYGVTYRKKFLQKLRAEDFPPHTVPLFVRCGSTEALSWAEALSDANRVYAYYIDDNFWRIVGSTPLAAYYRHPIVRRSLEFSIAHARAVITNSHELGRFVARFNRRTVVLPAFFDFSLIEGLKTKQTNEIRIGFGGSPSRVDDLELIAPLIGPIQQKFPEVVFEFAGALPKGVPIGERVRFFPHTGDYARYIRFQFERNWAIGLAPLVDHEANRGKTDNKYREYGACRCAGVYSDIPPYRGVVESSVTGLLVDNSATSWLEAVDRLISRPAERAALGQRAFEDVKRRYDLPRVAEEWAQLFLQLAAEQSQHTKPLNERRLKWKRPRRRLDAWLLHLAILRHEGGLALVLEGIVRKLCALRRSRQ